MCCSLESALPKTNETVEEIMFAQFVFRWFRFSIQKYCISFLAFTFELHPTLRLILASYPIFINSQHNQKHFLCTVHLGSGDARTIAHYTCTNFGFFDVCKVWTSEELSGDPVRLTCKPSVTQINHFWCSVDGHVFCGGVIALHVIGNDDVVLWALPL